MLSILKSPLRLPKILILSVLFSATLTSIGYAQSVNQVRSWAAACSNCHGTNGKAQPGMESLAGVSKATIVQKMQDFKAGKKPATVMHQLAKGYDDQQIEAIASFFAAKK